MKAGEFKANLGYITRPYVCVGGGWMEGWRGGQKRNLNFLCISLACTISRLYSHISYTWF
jgi:hypothetical protein